MHEQISKSRSDYSDQTALIKVYTICILSEPFDFFYYVVKFT